ncbi:epoxide hydrolase epha [Hyaloraphidium curvatum]|nr:epoxide hydrolase epha [Hyaloraphidium curvatum]
MKYTDLPAGVVQNRYRVNGVELDVLEAGEKGRPLVVCCHGFPDLSYAWRHQLVALAAAGWHAIAPDQRGYAGSSSPKDLPSYRIDNLCSDIIGLVDQIAGRSSKAVFIGHDWGANVVWSLLRLFPERAHGALTASSAISVSDSPPVESLRKAYGGKFMYIVYFNRPDEPEAELEADIRKTMLDSLYSASGPSSKRPAAAHEARPKEKTKYADLLVKSPDGKPPAWCTDAELDNYVRAFTESGFYGPLGWYRNMDPNHHLMRAFPPSRITMPVRFVCGAEDPFVVLAGGIKGFEQMKNYVPGLRDVVLIPGAGHWLQQEAPEAFNKSMLEFVGSLPCAPGGPKAAL